MLLHGLTSSWEIWQPVIEGLQSRHDVLAVTLPGHAGSSVAFRRPANVSGLADAVERILDTHGIEKAHIVGNSIGGWLAIELADRGRAKSVIAFAPAGGWARDPERRGAALFLMIRWLCLLTRPFSRLLAESRFVRRSAMRLFARRGDTLSPIDFSRAVEASLAVSLALVREFTAEGIRAYSDLGVPCLVVWSAQDRMLPGRGYRDRLERAVPWAEFIELAGVGHVPWIDEPELVVGLIDTWLNDHIDVAGG